MAQRRNRKSILRSLAFYPIATTPTPALCPARLPTLYRTRGWRVSAKGSKAHFLQNGGVLLPRRRCGRYAVEIRIRARPVLWLTRATQTSLLSPEKRIK